MKQRGFSSVMMLVLAVVVVGIGATAYMMQKPSDSNQEATSGDDTASTSANATVAKDTNSKSKSSSKTKVRACDILSLSKVSSITGVAMSHTPDLTEATKAYEDEDVWNSLCSFMETNGTVESNAGVVLMITEGLSNEAKAFVKEEFENTKRDEGGVNISGFGDKAFKVTSADDMYGYNSYYVLVGNMMIWTYSAVGHGTMNGERPEYTSTEKKDAETEAILKHILPQLK